MTSCSGLACRLIRCTGTGKGALGASFRRGAAIWQDFGRSSGSRRTGQGGPSWSIVGWIAPYRRTDGGKGAGNLAFQPPRAEMGDFSDPLASAFRLGQRPRGAVPPSRRRSYLSTVALGGLGILKNYPKPSPLDQSTVAEPPDRRHDRTLQPPGARVRTDPPFRSRSCVTGRRIESRGRG